MEQLAVAEGDLTAVRAGSGRDLVILHSLLTDRHAFDPVLPQLSRRFRVTLPNLPGFHGSKPVEGGLAAYIGWVARVLDAFDIGADPILMGNGFGGTLALAFALAHGERVGRLVLCDVAPGFPEAGKQAFRIMAATAAEGGMGAIAEIAAKRVFHTVHLGKYPEAVASLIILLPLPLMPWQCRICSALFPIYPRKPAVIWPPNWSRSIEGRRAQADHRA